MSPHHDHYPIARLHLFDRLLNSFPQKALSLLQGLLRLCFHDNSPGWILEAKAIQIADDFSVDVHVGFNDAGNQGTPLQIEDLGVGSPPEPGPPRWFQV